VATLNPTKRRQWCDRGQTLAVNKQQGVLAKDQDPSGFSLNVMQVECTRLITPEQVKNMLARFRDLRKDRTNALRCRGPRALVVAKDAALGGGVG
jgi:hypothetical protein